jgi:hypothetical protein
MKRVLVPFMSTRRSKPACLYWAQICWEVSPYSSVSKSYTWVWLFRWAGMPV